MSARSATGTREPDVGVLARARDGDEEAFAVLVRHFDPGLRALAFRLLGSRERMDDALQEAYPRAYGTRVEIVPVEEVAHVIPRSKLLSLRADEQKAA